MASKRRARSPSDSQQRASKLAAIESPSRRAPVPVPAPTQPPVPSTSRVPLSPRNINTPARKRTSSRLNPTAATPTAQKEEDDDDDEIYVTKLRDRAQRILHERAQPREAAAAAPVNNTRVNDDINTAENTTQEHLQRVQQLQDQPARTPVRVPSPPVTRSVARRQAATTASATPQDAAATQAQDGNESKQQNKAWTLDGLYHARLFGIQPGYEHLSPAQLERRIGDIQETMHTPPTRHAQDILIDSSPSSAAKQPTLLQAGAVAAVEQKKLKPEEALFTSDAAVGNDALRTPEKQPIKQTVINHARPTAIKPAADENAAAAALSAPGSSEVGDTDSQDTPPVAAEGSDDERDEPYVVWNWCDEDEGVPQPFQEEKYGYLNWTLRRTEDLSKPKKALAAVARREGGSDADDEQLDATRPHWNQLEYVNSDDMEQGPPHPACAVDDDELALAYECLELTQAVPQLAKRYELYDRLGEGTFSTVYKAMDRHHWTYDNSGWSPMDDVPRPKPPTSLRPVWVAIKRIYVTSAPVRIQNELELLRDLRGRSNISYLIEAIRHEDQVLAVMPYNHHQDFRTYFRTMPLSGIRNYFKALFQALRATHELQIIHRDVKPANFLFNTDTQTGVLCDFGLAERVGSSGLSNWTGMCLHSMPGPALGGARGKTRLTNWVKRCAGRPESRASQIGPGLLSGLHGSRLKRPISTWVQYWTQHEDYSALRDVMITKERQARAAHDDARVQRIQQQRNELRKFAPYRAAEDEKQAMRDLEEDLQDFYDKWDPYEEPHTHTRHNRVGYLKEEKDGRPSVRANRAGTRGFRAPEVLFKCPDQTVGLDIWSAGVILLSFLTRRFPFFQSNDDTEALLEIAALFGEPAMDQAANLHGRTFKTNIPSVTRHQYRDMLRLIKGINPSIIVENSPNPDGPIPSSDAEDTQWWHDSELHHAVDLLRKCLEPDLTKRWTAEECLEHPFIVGRSRRDSPRKNWPNVTRH